MLTAAENAGNKVGGDGLVSYLKWVALKHPSSFLNLLGRLMPQQLEPEQTSPPEEEKVLHTTEEIYEQLTVFGVPPETFAHALLAIHGVHKRLVKRHRQMIAVLKIGPPIRLLVGVRFE